MEPPKTALAGAGHFQWQFGGWFGGVLGASAWLVPTAAILAFKGLYLHALMTAGVCLLIVVTGVVLWARRDRIQPFPALIGFLVLLSILTPLIWVVLTFSATPAAKAALKWPKFGLSTVMVVLMCPALACWFWFLESRVRRRRTDPDQA